MNTRTLSTHPFLVLRDDILCDITNIAHIPLTTLLHAPATHQSATLQLLDEVPDVLLHLRITKCLAVQLPALIIMSPTTKRIASAPCRDGYVYILPTQIPSFAHIARTRPLPPHEDARRRTLLTHPQLDDCIALANAHGLISRTLAADYFGITTSAAATLLKSMTPLLYPVDATAKHFVYDAVAHQAVMIYPDEETLTAAHHDPRHTLPDVVRRYSNHLGKINQLPVRLNDRRIVLHYLAQQLPDIPMTEPQINAAILAHVAFDDYATARRDMVDLGFVMRTVNGSMYLRIDDVSN